MTPIRPRALVVAILSSAAVLLPAVAQGASSNIELFRIQAPYDEAGNIAAGTGGNMWLTEPGAKRVARITLDGQVAEFPVSFSGSKPRHIVAGPDGQMWFTTRGQTKDVVDRVARIDANGSITEVFASEGSRLGGLTATGDGFAWVTEGSAGQLRRFDAQGSSSEFQLPTASSEDPIAPAATGGLWILERQANKVAHVSPQGEITEIGLPPAREGPRDIATAADGGVWLAEFGRKALAHVTIDGQLTEFQTPPNTEVAPGSILADRHGSIWFTVGRGSIMRMDAKGAFAEFTVPDRPQCERRFPPCEREATPIDLAEGPDRKVWFLANGGSTGTAVGRIDPKAPPPIPSALKSPSPHGRTYLGQRITVRIGSWTNKPTGYSFRWQRCDRRGVACNARPGRGESTVLSEKDIGHTLRASVAAENESGSTFMWTASTSVVRKAPSPLRVEIGGTHAHLGPGGTAKVRLSCEAGPPGSFCAGLVRLTLHRRTGMHFRVDGPEMHPSPRSEELGRIRYRLRTGHEQLVSVRLTDDARALLAHAPRHRLRARVTATLWGGHPSRRELILRTGP